MNKTQKHSLALLLGMLAIGASRSDAAEWTTTVDRHTTVSGATTIVGELAATTEAFWIGPDRAFDPQTGADIPPYALPERISLVDSQYGVSSQRGQLWKGYFFFDFMPYLQADSDEGFWGMAGYGTTEAVHLAKDGAQMKRWTAADLGHADMHVIAVNPLLEDAGALVLIGNASSARALRLDHRGRTAQQVVVPACATNVADDRHGGIYALCPTSESGAGEVHHIGPTEAGSWSRGIGSAELTRASIGADGGILVRDSTSSGQSLWKSFDRQGNLRLSVRATAGVAVDDGFWFLRGTGTHLTHYGLDGLVLASVNAMSVSKFVAHSSGTLLASGRFDPNNPSNVYRLISGSGATLREFSEREPKVSILGPNIFWGSTVATLRVNSGIALIGDDGELSSAAINQSSFMSPENVQADASTVCISGMRPIMPGIHGTECFDRLTGQSLLGPSGVGDVLHIDGNILSAVVGAFEIKTRNGALLLRISRDGEIAWGFHPRQGLALLRVIDGAKRLQRFRVDGSLVFDVAAPFVSGEAIIGVGSDGSTIIAGEQSPALLLRYDAEGNLRAMGDIELSKPSIPLVSVSSSSEGVLLLQREGDDYTTYSGQLTMLDAQLVRHAEYPFSRVQTAKLQPARAGTARFVYTTPSGLIVQQFNPTSGQPGERRALPTQNTGVRFTIDLDGVVRAITFDAALGREVLRISRPTPGSFTGPIRQSALSGAWFNPASTGQGLLLQLLNGNVLFGAWHTYAPEGGNALSKQQWFTVSGEVTNQRGRITVPIYRNGNGRFDTDGTTPAEAVGSAELVFTSCDQMEFWYRIGEDTGAFPLQRLTPRTQACDDGSATQPPLDAPKGLAIDGAWYVPAQSGQGLTFNTTGARFGGFLAGWFTYDTATGIDDEAAQHWFTLQGATPEHYGESVTAQIHRTIGGSRAGEPTRNTHAVGQATLTVHDCAHATLSYVFDDSVIAGSFANLHRNVPLVRLGACTQ